jgi:hypothetical protein
VSFTPSHTTLVAPHQHTLPLLLPRPFSPLPAGALPQPIITNLVIFTTPCLIQ